MFRYVIAFYEIGFFLQEFNFSYNQVNNNELSQNIHPLTTAIL